MLQKMVFLGTGGTIAGTAATATDNVGYTAAQVGVAQLLRAIPTLQHALADWAPESEQVAQIDSKDMGWAQWRALGQRICHHLAQADVRAIVITHGTDTIEETAFFLSQVLPTHLLLKPVVLTCAMRPASSLSPDGPQNVLDAVAVARSRDARGVLVVCAGTVHSARDVQKVHPYRLDAFDSGDAGPLGFVEEARVRWLHPCPVGGTSEVGLPERLLSMNHWPRVEIVMSYAGAVGLTVRALCAAPPDSTPPVRGIVVAGTGNGTIHEDLQTALRDLLSQGLRVLRTTRCAHGTVVCANGAHDQLRASALPPLKARIALALELLVEESIP
jgi:L-asparaginase